jgi:hypothetical protein
MKYAIQNSSRPLVTIRQQAVGISALTTSDGAALRCNIGEGNAGGEQLFEEWGVNDVILLRQRDGIVTLFCHLVV